MPAAVKLSRIGLDSGFRRNDGQARRSQTCATGKGGRSRNCARQEARWLLTWPTGGEGRLAFLGQGERPPRYQTWATGEARRLQTWPTGMGGSLRNWARREARELQACATGTVGRSQTCASGEYSTFFWSAAGRFQLGGELIEALPSNRASRRALSMGRQMIA